jgi:hypothetical protein
VSDLHETFETWLVRGAREELPRGVALHASACSDCLRAAAALDALAAIDPGAAEMPPIRIYVGRGDRRRRLVPVMATAAVAVLAVATGIVAGTILLGPPADDDVAAATPTIAEGVLGGGIFPTDSASATASATPSATPTSTMSPSPTPIVGEGPQQPNPTMGGGPPPTTDSPSTPRPTATPRAVTPTPTPVVTAEPTDEPTPVPTLVPTPIPTPTPQCSDGIDNDDDGFTDFGSDLGCLSPDDDDESDL